MAHEFDPKKRSAKRAKIESATERNARLMDEAVVRIRRRRGIPDRPVRVRRVDPSTLARTPEPQAPAKVEIPDVALTYAPKKCEECEDVFQPTSGRQRFCSTRCRERATAKRQASDPESVGPDYRRRYGELLVELLERGEDVGERISRLELDDDLADRLFALAAKDPRADVLDQLERLIGITTREAA